MGGRQLALVYSYLEFSGAAPHGPCPKNLLNPEVDNALVREAVKRGRNSGLRVS